MQDDHTFICLLVRVRNGGFFPLQKYLVEVILQFRYQKAFSDCIYLVLSPLRLLTCFSFQPRQSTGFDIQRNRATHLGKREEYWGFSWNEIFQEQEARKLILKSESRCWGISWEYVNGCSSFNLISSAEQDRKWRPCWDAHTRASRAAQKLCQATGALLLMQLGLLCASQVSCCISFTVTNTWVELSYRNKQADEW